MARTPGFQLPFSEAIRKETGLLTMGVGLIREGEQASKVLTEGRADLVALGRELLWNPNWPAHIAIEHDVPDAWKLFPDQYGWWLRRRKAQQGS